MTARHKTSDRATRVLFGVSVTINIAIATLIVSLITGIGGDATVHTINATFDSLGVPNGTPRMAAAWWAVFALIDVAIYTALIRRAQPNGGVGPTQRAQRAYIISAVALRAICLILSLMPLSWELLSDNSLAGFFPALDDGASYARVCGIGIGYIYVALGLLGMALILRAQGHMGRQPVYGCAALLQVLAIVVTDVPAGLGALYGFPVGLLAVGCVNLAAVGISLTALCAYPELISRWLHKLRRALAPIRSWFGRPRSVARESATSTYALLAVSRGLGWFLALNYGPVAYTTACGELSYVTTWLLAALWVYHALRAISLTPVRGRPQVIWPLEVVLLYRLTLRDLLVVLAAGLRVGSWRRYRALWRRYRALWRRGQPLSTTGTPRWILPSVARPVLRQRAVWESWGGYWVLPGRALLSGTIGTRERQRVGSSIIVVNQIRATGIAADLNTWFMTALSAITLGGAVGMGTVELGYQHHQGQEMERSGSEWVEYSKHVDRTKLSPSALDALEQANSTAAEGGAVSARILKGTAFNIQGNREQVAEQIGRVGKLRVCAQGIVINSPADQDVQQHVFEFTGVPGQNYQVASGSGHQE